MNGGDSNMNNVVSLNELTQENYPFAGGKGTVLAVIKQQRFPVPEGFVVLSHAFCGGALSDSDVLSAIQKVAASVHAQRIHACADSRNIPADGQVAVSPPVLLLPGCQLTVATDDHLFDQIKIPAAETQWFTDWDLCSFCVSISVVAPNLAKFSSMCSAEA